jgi:hypothetical protein
LVAGLAGVYAWKQSEIAGAEADKARVASALVTSEAEKARTASVLADKRAAEADELRKQTQVTESGLLSEAAKAAAERDPLSAMLLALEGMPDAAANIARPLVFETRFAWMPPFGSPRN